MAYLLPSGWGVARETETKCGVHLRIRGPVGPSGQHIIAVVKMDTFQSLRMINETQAEAVLFFRAKRDT